MPALPFLRAATCAAATTILSCVAISSAVAQIYPSPAPYYGIGPGHVVARVESMGLRTISEPRLRGPVWAVRAEGRDGTIVRVLIDAESGQVVNIVALDRPYLPRVAGRGPINEGPWVPMGPGEDDMPPPAGYGPPGYTPPPAGYPSPGYAAPQSSYGTGQGTNKVAARPATPLPKPRPTDAQGAKEEGAAVAAAPKDPITTGSGPTPGRKVEGADATTPQTAPINPLE
jgi:hypothetical protein